MKRNARTASNALKKLGAPIYDSHGYGCHFVIGAELRTSDDTYYADYWQEELKEYRDEAGKIQNAFGIRTDVNEILAKHDLYAEWINAGMVGVYDR